MERGTKGQTEGADQGDAGSQTGTESPKRPGTVSRAPLPQRHRVVQECGGRTFTAVLTHTASRRQAIHVQCDSNGVLLSTQDADILLIHLE